MLGADPPAPPEPPPIPPPTPLPDETMTDKAKKKKRLELVGRSGREATFLSDAAGDSDTLGG